MAIIRDISERKRADQALQQHYQELRAIYDGMAEGLVILDIETNECVRVNRSICALLGYSEKELRTLPAEKLQVPEMLSTLGRATPSHDRRAAVAQRRRTVGAERRQRGVRGYRVGPDHLQRAPLPDPSAARHHRATQAQEALKKEHRTLKHLLQSSDHERQLIAYEIHDGLAQQLAGAIMQIETYWHQKEAKPQEAAKAYDAADHHAAASPFRGAAPYQRRSAADPRRIRHRGGGGPSRERTDGFKTG